MPVNSVVRVVELPKRCRIRPRRPRCGRRRLSRAELAPHLMPGNQPSHGLRARHQLYLPRQLGAGAAVSPHKRASHAAQAAAAAPPPHPRGRRDGWSCHNSLVAAPTLFTAAPGRFYGPPASHPGGPSRGLLSPQDLDGRLGRASGAGTAPRSRASGCLRLARCAAGRAVRGHAAARPDAATRCTKASDRPEGSWRA